MPVILGPDVLHLIGDILYSRVTLAALTRVSKSFNQIFTPYLYRRIQIQDCEFKILDRLSDLPESTHLRHTKKLHIGRELKDRDSEEALTKCLNKMPDLESLTLTSCIEDFDLEPDGEDGEALAALAERGKLRELVLVASDLEEFDDHLPRFRNLRKLTLWGLWRTDHEHRHDDIIEILIASPNLQHLGLSNGSFNDDDAPAFQNLCVEFDTRRKQLNCPLLRLTELELGVAYQPEESWSPSNGNGSYLSKLTDLTYLKSLVLYDRYRSSQIDNGLVKIHLPLFYPATNISHISAFPMTADALDLITYVCKANPLAMSSCSTYDAWEGAAEDPYNSDYGSFIFPPIFQTNYHWRSFSCTRKLFQKNGDYWKDLISRWNQLEELGCPLDLSVVDLFKTSILPNLKCLRTLMIDRGPFPDPEPSIENITEEERETEIHGEDERKLFAEELFRISWEAWEIRDEQQKGNKLQYLGLGYRVYTYMFPAPGELGDTPRVVRLSLDEARTFEVIERSYWSKDMNPFWS